MSVPTQRDPVDAITDAIVDLYDTHLRLRPARDAFASDGRARLHATIRPFVDGGRPVAFLLPGFAFKNPNRKKTLGPLPDLAETRAFDHLEAFGAAVSAIYKPKGFKIGCQITIFADGRVWGDLLGVDRPTQQRYAIALRRLTRARPHLRVADLGDVLRRPDITAVEQGWYGDEAIARLDATLADPDSSAFGVFERFTRLVIEDRSWPADTPPDTVIEIARAAARRMMIRHAAFTAVLAERFADAVRLTVHPRADAGPKFSVRFELRIPQSAVAPLLAYHSVAVLDADGRFEGLMTREDAEALPGGVDLITTDEGHPWCLGRRP